MLAHCPLSNWIECLVLRGRLPWPWPCAPLASWEASLPEDRVLASHVKATQVTAGGQIPASCREA
jgi:hypothetical protein